MPSPGTTTAKEATTGIGAGIFLVAVGAILKFATNLHVSGIEIDTVGVILMLVGLAWLALALSLFYRRRSEVLTQRRSGPNLSGDPRLSGDQYIEERRVYDTPPDPY